LFRANRPLHTGVVGLFASRFEDGSRFLAAFPLYLFFSVPKTHLCFFLPNFLLLSSIGVLCLKLSHVFCFPRDPVSDRDNVCFFFFFNTCPRLTPRPLGVSCPLISVGDLRRRHGPPYTRLFVELSGHASSFQVSWRFYTRGNPTSLFIFQIGPSTPVVFLFRTLTVSY